MGARSEKGRGRKIKPSNEQKLKHRIIKFQSTTREEQVTHVGEATICMKHFQQYYFLFDIAFYVSIRREKEE